MFNDDIVKATRINIDEAKKSMTDFLQLMHRFDSLSWNDVKDIITVGIWDTAEKERLLHLCIEGEENFQTPTDVPHLEFGLRSKVPPSIQAAERIGGSAGVGSLVFKPELFYDSWPDANPDLLISNLTEGTFSRYHGKPRKGKTNAACITIERWINKKYIALSNIYKEEIDNRYIYVRDAMDLFASISTLPKAVPFLFIFDEGFASGYSTATATTIYSRYFDALIRIVGKLYGNVLYIEQRPQSTPTIIKEWSETALYAIEHDDRAGVIHLELLSPKHYSRTFKDFPKTSLPFRTRDPSVFEMNVNVEKMLHEISGVPNPMEKMLEFLDSPEADPANRHKKNPQNRRKTVTIDSKISNPKKRSLKDELDLILDGS